MEVQIEQIRAAESVIHDILQGEGELGPGRLIQLVVERDPTIPAPAAVQAMWNMTNAGRLRLTERGRLALEADTQVPAAAGHGA